MNATAVHNETGKNPLQHMSILRVELLQIILTAQLIKC